MDNNYDFYDKCPARTSSVFVRQVRKPPDVSQPHCISNACEDEFDLPTPRPPSHRLVPCWSCRTRRHFRSRLARLRARGGRTSGRRAAILDRCRLQFAQLDAYVINTLKNPQKCSFYLKNEKPHASYNSGTGHVRNKLEHAKQS